MRALLIEDDSTAAASIKMTLRAENFIVDTTDLGEDGLEIGKLYDYDIIILDLMLPDIRRRSRALWTKCVYQELSISFQPRPLQFAPNT